MHHIELKFSQKKTEHGIKLVIPVFLTKNIEQGRNILINTIPCIAKDATSIRVKVMKIKEIPK